MAKHYNTQNDSASLSAFFFYVHNVSFVSTPLSPSCEEGVLNPLPSPRPFQKGKGCNFYAIKEIFPNHPVPPS